MLLVVTTRQIFVDIEFPDLLQGEALSLESGDDLPHQASCDPIGLDHDESAFDCHVGGSVLQAGQPSDQQGSGLAHEVERAGHENRPVGPGLGASHVESDLRVLGRNHGHVGQVSDPLRQH